MLDDDCNFLNYSSGNKQFKYVYEDNFRIRRY